MEKLSIEQLQATFFDNDALLVQPAPIYRMQGDNGRYYYDFDAEGNPRFFVSVTTFIKQTMPTSPYLIEWIAKHGYEESKEIAEERAHYGTFLHIQLASLLINGRYDLDNLKKELNNYLFAENMPASLIAWHEELKKDILAFAQFMIEYQVKPLAIEIILTNPYDGYAGAIDLVCEMTIEEKGFFGEVYKSGVNAGQPKETKRSKRVRAIVDFKSGRKGFYEDHEIQLHAYKKAWDIHFDAYPVEKLYNWSPKNWRAKTPTYNLKDQTNAKSAQKLDYLVQLMAVEEEGKDNNVLLTSGTIDIKNGIDNNIMILSMADAVKQAREQEPEKTEQNNENDLPNS